jgi:hypothetical protein
VTLICAHAGEIISRHSGHLHDRPGAGMPESYRKPSASAG